MDARPVRKARLTGQEAREMIIRGLLTDESDSSLSESDPDSGQQSRDEIRASDDEDFVAPPANEPSSSSDSDVDLERAGPSTSTTRAPRPRSRSRPTVGKGRGLSKGKARATIARYRSRSPLPSRSRPTTVAQEEGVIQWESVTAGRTFNSFRHVPPRPAGVNEEVVPANASPLTCLRTLLTDEVMGDLVDSINAYADHRCQMNTPARRRSLFAKWYPVTVMELWKFFAVIIAMGITKKPKVSDYWAVQEPHMSTPWFSQMFRRDRFQAIYHSMFKASAVDAEGKAKVEPFINKVIANFQLAFYPFQNLSLDEMVIGWKGRWAHKMFNASKPKKYHVKTFGLCDSNTGYVIDILIYFGADTSYNPLLDKDSQQAIKVFDKLLQSCFPGHHIFADRYYTSFPLLQYLSEKGFYYTGTVNVNRRNFPPEFKTAKLAHREMQWFIYGLQYLSVMYRDKKAKKPCVLVSSSASVDTVTRTTRAGDVIKPVMIDSYNNSMNGCDRVDQCVGTYGTFNRRTRKWWKKIFYWFFEICQLNAFVLHALSKTTPDTKRQPTLAFKNILIRELCELAATDAVPQPTGQGHQIPVNPLAVVTGNRHILVRHRSRCRQCVVCSTPQSRRRTSFYCEGCPNQPHLHPNECNKRYHSH